MFTREFFDQIGWKWQEGTRWLSDFAISPCERMWVARPDRDNRQACYKDASGDRVVLPRTTLRSPNEFLLTCHLLGVSTSDTRPRVYVIMKGAAEGCFLSEQEANSQAADIGSRFYGSGVEVEVHHVPLGPADGPL